MVLNTRLTTSTALTAGAPIPVGTIVHQNSGYVRASGNTIEITGAGYFKITASVTVEPTAVADMVVTMYRNGVEIAQATATPAVASDSVNLSLVGVVYNKCACFDSAITLAVGSAGTVTECDVVVERI